MEYHQYIYVDTYSIILRIKSLLAKETHNYVHNLKHVAILTEISHLLATKARMRMIPKCDCVTKSMSKNSTTELSMCLLSTYEQFSENISLIRSITASRNANTTDYEFSTGVWEHTYFKSKDIRTCRVY